MLIEFHLFRYISSEILLPIKATYNSMSSIVSVSISVSTYSISSCFHKAACPFLPDQLRCHLISRLAVALRLTPFFTALKKN